MAGCGDAAGAQGAPLPLADQPPPGLPRVRACVHACLACLCCISRPIDRFHHCMIPTNTVRFILPHPVRTPRLLHLHLLRRALPLLRASQDTAGVASVSKTQRMSDVHPHICPGGLFPDTSNDAYVIRSSGCSRAPSPGGWTWRRSTPTSGSCSGSTPASTSTSTSTRASRQRQRRRA